LAKSEYLFLEYNQQKVTEEKHVAEVAENEVVENGAVEENVENTEAEITEAPVAESTESTESAPDAEAAPEASASSAPVRDAEGFTSALPSVAEGADEPRKHVPGGVGYEIIYVVKAGDAALIESTSQHVRELIEQGEGAVDNVRASEVRRFAYPINKQNEGVYVVVNARFKPTFIGELERYFKIDENILRHMTLKEDR
jgi:small subunit ribosomal protein S6